MALYDKNKLYEQSKEAIEKNNLKKNKYRKKLG